jgi:hypothetical protein
MTSHNPRDEAEGYCGHCHDFTSHPSPAIALLARVAADAAVAEHERRYHPAKEDVMPMD